MIDEVNAAEGGEGEVASTDLRSIIQNAVEKQSEAPAPETPAEPVEAEAEKPSREDGRDDRGRFVSKNADAEAEPAETLEAEKPAEETPVTAPPVGWSVAAKAAFGDLPDEVKQAIAKREDEVNKGFQRYGGLKQYAEIAEQNGTSLATAVADYAKVEDSLRKDFLSGLDSLAARFGYSPKDVAQYYAARHGVPYGDGQQPNAAYQQPTFDPNAIVQQAKAAMQDEFERRESLSEIQRFSSDPNHPYFENVREDMALLIQNGKATSLQDAYEMACWANPETRAILLRSQLNPTPNAAQAVQKAKAAAKAVGGAPAPGFNPGAKDAPKNMSIREAAMHAVNQQLGR